MTTAEYDWENEGGAVVPCKEIKEIKEVHPSRTPPPDKVNNTATFRKDVPAYKIALACYEKFDDKEQQKQIVSAIGRAQKKGEKFDIVFKSDDWTGIWSDTYCPCCVPTEFLEFQ